MSMRMQAVKDALNKSSPRRKPGTSFLISLDSGSCALWVFAGMTKVGLFSVSLLQ